MCMLLLSKRKDILLSVPNNVNLGALSEKGCIIHVQGKQNQYMKIQIKIKHAVILQSGRPSCALFTQGKDAGNGPFETGLWTESYLTWLRLFEKKQNCMFLNARQLLFVCDYKLI